MQMCLKKLEHCFNTFEQMAEPPPPKKKKTKKTGTRQFKFLFSVYGHQHFHKISSRMFDKISVQLLSSGQRVKFGFSFNCWEIVADMLASQEI